MKHTLSIALLLIASMVFAQKQVSIHSPDNQPTPILYGIGKLKQAFIEKGFNITETNLHVQQFEGPVIITGLPQNNPVIENFAAGMQKVPESVFIKRNSDEDNPLIIASGSDATGVMYALLELVSQVKAMSEDDNIFQSVQNINERPYCTERSLSTQIKAEHIRNGFFHDSRYWDVLFEQLAASRINLYNLIFKLRAPIYTLFFDVEGWPANTTGGIVVSSEEQERNLTALQSIVLKAHNHGVKITLGIWNHVSNPDDADRLAGYTEQAIARIIKLVPFDAFQFRMHWESGLPREMDMLCNFWSSVYDGIKQSGRKIKIYPRAKGLPDTIINIGVHKGMDFAIETKYSAEQMGMPFHPAQIQKQNQTDRRHGYADLLSYPKNYTVLYRVWNWGSQKLTVWGDTDWSQVCPQHCAI